jgi:hypothetical protein
LYKQQAEASTADDEPQADATMMGTTATDNNQPAAAGKVGVWHFFPIGPPNSAVSQGSDNQNCTAILQGVRKTP